MKNQPHKPDQSRTPTTAGHQQDNSRKMGSGQEDMSRKTGSSHDQDTQRKSVSSHEQGSDKSRHGGGNKNH